VNAGLDVGATTCLRALLSDNLTLLKTHVGADTVHKFVELVADVGPKPQYMRFFSDISSCKGQPVESNQEAVLLALYMQPEVRRAFLVQSAQFSDKKLAEGQNCKEGARMDIITHLAHWDEPNDNSFGRDGQPVMQNAKVGR
jgi:hypothetical protein